MNLFEQITADYKTAYKARDAVGKGALSFLISQIKNKKIELGRDLNDDEVMKMIQKEVKMLKETAESLAAQSMTSQLEEEQAKIDRLEAYLPAMLSEEELKAIVEAKKTALGIADEDVSRNKGKLIGMIMKEYGATVDGRMLNGLVNS